MACNLSKDPSGAFDALCAVSATATILVESDASPTATVVSASLNGVKAPVDAHGNVSLTGFHLSTNVLSLVVVGVQPHDDIHLVEACPDSTKQRLKKKSIGTGPGGGADPLVSFRIRAT